MRAGARQAPTLLVASIRACFRLVTQSVGLTQRVRHAARGRACQCHGPVTVSDSESLGGQVQVACAFGVMPLLRTAAATVRTVTVTV